MLLILILTPKFIRGGPCGPNILFFVSPVTTVKILQLMYLWMKLGDHGGNILNCTHMQGM